MVGFFNQVSSSNNTQQTHPATRLDAEAIKKGVGNYITAASKLDNPDNKTACAVLQTCHEHINDALHGNLSESAINNQGINSQNDATDESVSKSSRAFLIS